MFKTFVFGFIVGIALLLVGGVAGFQPTQKSTEAKRKEQELELYKTQKSDATQVQLGVLTELQRSHSKLYGSYQRQVNAKISELAKQQETNVVGVELFVGTSENKKPTEPEAFFANIAKISDTVIRGKVINKASQITEDDSFIFTDYNIVITEVLKNNTKSLIDAGTQITVTRPGGRIVVNEVIVGINDHHVLPLPAGSNEVLLFLKLIPDTGTYQSARYDGSYEIVGNSLRPLTRVQLPPGALQSNSSLLQLVRDLLK
jgi:hypothetical protein